MIYISIVPANREGSTEYIAEYKIWVDNVL